VRTFARSALEEGGYIVIAASTAREALQTLEQAHLPVSLLIADLVMPDLGGRALVDQLRADGRDLPVLFISGYAGESAVAQGLRPGEHFLAKPFGGAELLRKVRQVLEPDEAEADPPARTRGLRLDS